MSVSILFRFCKDVSFVPLLAILRSAWSLCCQQKNAVAAVSVLGGATAETLVSFETEDLFFGDGVRERRHGRPLDVMPLQVVASFLESDRGKYASGVFGINIITSAITHITCWWQRNRLERYCIKWVEQKGWGSRDQLYFNSERMCNNEGIRPRDHDLL